MESCTVERDEHLCVTASSLNESHEFDERGWQWRLFVAGGFLLVSILAVKEKLHWHTLDQFIRIVYHCGF